MQADDLYQSWKKTKTDIEVPLGLADKVMASIRRQSARPSARGLRDRLYALILSKCGRVAVCLLAGAAYLFRLRQVVAIFLE